MSKISFKWIKDSNYEDCFKVRKEVFIKEQNISYDKEYDGIDNECDHIVGYVDNTPIATGRILVKDNKYYLGRICVLKEYRGFGYGIELIKEMIKYLEEKNIKEIYLSSQYYIKDLYSKLGFMEYGKTYLDCNIEHISMVYRR